MKNSELKNKLIAWLEAVNKKYVIRPQQFTPTEIANEINGSYMFIGKVAFSACDELNARGVNVCYRKIGNSRLFVLI